MSLEYRSIVLGPGEGRLKAMPGIGVEVVHKAVGAETGGAYFLTEYKAPPGWAGPPMHVHNSMEEGFYVLEGSLTAYLDGQEVNGGVGAFVQIPRGAAHTFANWGATPARYLLLVTPAGFEGYFEDLTELAEKHGFPLPPEIAATLEKKYDFMTVGPRPSR